jgi:hypothetical protein
MPPVRRRTQINAAAPIAAGDGLPILDDMQDPSIDAVDVILDAPADVMVDGVGITEGDDGSAVVDFEVGQSDPLDPGAQEHEANLAEFMPEDDLSGLAEALLSAVESDRKSRSDWESMMTEGIKYLGLKFEERTYPFQGASGVYDTIMLEAVIRWHAMATAELMPASGPVKTQIIGIPDENSDAQSSRVKEFMNYYLTEGAPEYIEENDQMLMWLPLVGSTFKKTYQDPILNRPVSSFVSPNNLIVNFGATDIDTAPRKTHLIEMDKSDVKKRQLAGFYRDCDLPEPGAEDAEGEKDQIKNKINEVQGLQKPDPVDPGLDQSYSLYEVHAQIDLVGFEHTSDDGDETGLPLPYIVTIERTSRKVLSIRRNWRAGDTTYEPIGYFTHFKFVPGLGFYGYGYAHILGNPAKGATSLQRQMIDAATLAMFPGGLRVKGMRMDNNNKMIAPCEFIEIETGGLPINQAVSPMPYRGPDEVSLQLWRDSRENAQRLAGGAEIAVGEGRQDAPVGTTVALLEAANRPQSGTIKNCHRAYRREFKLIAALFGQYLPETPYPFPVAGGNGAIMRADFGPGVDVIPVSDPNITSSAQRMMRAEALLRFATQAPLMHNQYEAYKQMYVEMGIDPGKIERLLQKPDDAVPMDPLSENQNALMGKPVKAGPWQDDDAHIATHMPLAEQLPTIQAHIAEHMANKMRKNVEKTLGMQLPPMGTKLPPEIENQIAVLTSQAVQQLEGPKQENPTPEQVAMKQVEVEAQKVAMSAQKTQAETQVKAFMAQLKANSEEKDRQVRLQVAEMQARSRRAERAERNAAGLQRRKF